MDPLEHIFINRCTQTLKLYIINFAAKHRMSAIEVLQNYVFEYEFVDLPSEQRIQVSLQMQARRLQEPRELTESMKYEAESLQHLIDSVHEG